MYRALGSEIGRDFFTEGRINICFRIESRVGGGSPTEFAGKVVNPESSPGRIIYLLLPFLSLRALTES